MIIPKIPKQNHEYQHQKNTAKHLNDKKGDTR